MLLLAGIVIKLFDPLAHILLLAYAAAILAVVLNAVVTRIPLSRGWATAVLGLVIVAVLGTALWLGGNLLFAQLADLVRNLPEIQAELQRWILSVQQKVGIDLSGVAQRVVGGVDEAASAVVGRVWGGFQAALLAISILFGALFALASPDKMLLEPLLRAVPHRSRPDVRRALDLLGNRLLGWMRARLLSMCFVGITATLSFYFIGVPDALLLGVINALTEFVPIFGPWLGAIPAVILMLVNDPGRAIYVAAAATAIQLVQNNLVAPLVQSSQAHVHPFVVLFALVFFGWIFGFLGILLSIPLVLLIGTIVEVFWVERALHAGRDDISPVVES